MTAEGKVVVTIVVPREEEPSTPKDDGDLPHLLIANAVVETTNRRDVSLMELRMVLPSRNAVAVLRGMLEGEIEIAITGMSPVAGRE
jgi:hypothetical protein